jgi:flagellar basal-body rod protein FlgC
MTQPMFPLFATAGSALNTQQLWMDAIAENIANINTVKPMSQPAYQEKFVVAQEVPSNPGDPVGVGGGVEPVAIQLGDATGLVTYDPTNPLADKNGLVRRPDENLGDQMTNMIIAERAYQMNLTVVQRAQEAYQQALNINGK